MQKRTIAAIATAAALALGVIGSTALAESPPPSAKPSASPQSPKPKATETEQQQPSFTGSIRAPQGAEGPSEKDESAALNALAKVSETDARAAALAKFPGATIQKATLEDENGSVVWAIELTDATKANQEVKVDAGNGAILAVEAGGAEGESGEKD